jgi:hypothetical protein
MAVQEKVNPNPSPMKAEDLAAILCLIADIQKTALEAYASNRTTYAPIVEALDHAGETISRLRVRYSPDCGWIVCDDGSCQQRCPKIW